MSQAAAIPQPPGESDLPDHAQITPSRGSTASQPKPPSRWKLVLAADQPWVGRIYPTRSGKQRETFDCPEQFVQAVMRLTGWEWPVVGADTSIAASHSKKNPYADKEPHR